MVRRIDEATRPRAAPCTGYYIFEPTYRRAFARRVIERAADGVHVRLLIRAVGSAYIERFSGRCAQRREIAFFHSFGCAALRPKLNAQPPQEVRRRRPGRFTGGSLTTSRTNA